MRFVHSQLVQVSNISIFGNWHRGCSSIIIKESALDFNDSIFIGINGFLGAALVMSASNITFRGSNVFTGNAAISGGSVYLTDSMLTLNGTSLFLNNNSTIFSQEVIKRKMLSCNYIKSMRKIELLNHSGGTLNGLFFYANIIQANHQAFLPRTFNLTVNFFTASYHG